MTKITQIYLPGTHSNGERLVQITNQDGAFCGWADGRGKYDIKGTWTIDEAWSPCQAAQLADEVSELKNSGRVSCEKDGVLRRLTITF